MPTSPRCGPERLADINNPQFSPSIRNSVIVTGGGGGINRRPMAQRRRLLMLNQEFWADGRAAIALFRLLGFLLGASQQSVLETPSHR